MYSFSPALTLPVDPAYLCVDRMAVVTLNHIPAATCPPSRQSNIIAWKDQQAWSLHLCYFVESWLKYFLPHGHHTQRGESEVLAVSILRHVASQQGTCNGGKVICLYV